MVGVIIPRPGHRDRTGSQAGAVGGIPIVEEVVTLTDDKGFRGEARTLGMAGGPVAGAGEHSLQIVNREQVTVQGVLAVESFDDEEIILETEMGMLTLRGEELHIKQLDLESGKFAVEGFVNSLVYAAPRQRGGRATKGRSFLERLLK